MSRWIQDELDSNSSGYEEGQSVPILLRIDGARRGQTYQIEISYDCLSSGHPAFDYLAGLGEETSEPLATSPGPGETLADSTLTRLDDPSIEFDDTEAGAIGAWGAVFSAATAPTPQTVCTGAKTVNLSLLAQDEQILLAWTAHLGSSADWGDGRGAALATPFGLTTRVNGEVALTVTMLDGAVGRP